MTSAATRMDALLLRLLEASAGTEIPQGARPHHLPGVAPWAGFETVLNVPVDGLRQRSYQWWVSQLPIKLGGLGIRLQSSLSPISYLGSLEKVLPSFANSNLGHLYSEGAPDHRMYATLLESGSRLGAEFAAAWNTVKGEAVQCCNFLGVELPFYPSILFLYSVWVRVLKIKMLTTPQKKVVDADDFCVQKVISLEVLKRALEAHKKS